MTRDKAHYGLLMSALLDETPHRCGHGVLVSALKLLHRSESHLRVQCLILELVSKEQ